MKIKHQLKVPVKSMAVINVARTEVLVEKVALGHLEILVIEVNFSVELAMHYSAGKYTVLYTNLILILFYLQPNVAKSLRNLHVVGLTCMAALVVRCL